MSQSKGNHCDVSMTRETYSCIVLNPRKEYASRVMDTLQWFHIRHDPYKTHDLHVNMTRHYHFFGHIYPI